MEDKAFDIFLNKKADLERLIQNDINEANTRLKIIDVIFIEILGWNKTEEIILEETVGNRKHKKLYVDYVFESDLNKFLIEAKRVESYFNIPKTHNKIYKSTGVIRNGNENYIDQAVNYMNSLGTPFCVLCNGNQFIIIRKKSLSRNKDVFVFRDFNDIQSNFTKFYNILSPFTNGVEELDGSLERQEELRNPPSFTKRVLDSVDKNEQLVGNQAKIAIEEYLRKYFSDLTSDSKSSILEESYCDPSGILSTHSQNLSQHLLPKSMSAIRQVQKKDKFKDFGNFEDKYLESLSEESNVFILLGSVGVGKSTFLSHFYYHELDYNKRKNIIWIKIDFLEFTRPISKLDDFILQKIYEVLENEYNKIIDINEWDIRKKIYKEDLVRIRKGLPPHQRTEEKISEELFDKISNDISGNLENFLEKVFTYIRGDLGKNICLVFDNTDQKQYEEQKEILMHSYQKAKKFISTVIIALRYENYFEMKNKPPLDAYQPIEFRIEAPSVKELLAKRIEISKRYPKEHFILGIKNKTIKVPMVKFVNLLENTFNSPQGKSVQDLFENLSEKNMRRALALFQRFTKAGNSKLYEMVDVLPKINHHIVDYENVFDGLIRGYNKYYNSDDEGTILNLFRYYDDGFYSHFTIIYLLKFLEQKLRINNGFVKIEELQEKFSNVILSKDKLMNILEFMMSNYLINSNLGERSYLLNTNAIAISRQGVYYINNLLMDINYYRHVIYDTPIKNNDTFKKLKDLFSKGEKALNFDRKRNILIESVNIFLEYLKSSEEEDLSLLTGGTLSLDQLPFRPIMDEIIRDINVSIEQEKKDKRVVLF